LINLAFFSRTFQQNFSLATMANLGVPVKLLHESVGHVVTVELKTGQVSR
jgi:hypothetical protein